LKDLFSTQADLYAKYRPVYPPELYEFILKFVHHKHKALDCATGNGQVARVLASHFQRVSAVDISENQLNHAVKLDNIEYAVCRAERTPFEDNSFDLITVAQAYHWFNGHQFCREAKRISRPDGIIAIWVYDLASSGSPIDAIVHRWNFDTLAPYWEEERKHVYTHYQNLPFEFEPIESPQFQIVVEWTSEEVIGHLKTWSALQKMKAEVGDSAFGEVVGEIRRTWGTERAKRFVFPLFLKLGRVRK